MTKLHFVLIVFLMLFGCSGEDGNGAATLVVPPQSVENWTIVSSLPFGATPTGLALSNNIAYIANYNLSLVDVSDPVSPVVVHTITANAGTLGNIYGVSVSGDRMLVSAAPPCNGLCNYVPGAGVLEFFDTSDPSNPIKISEQSMEASDVLLEGNIAYVSMDNLQSQVAVIDMSVQPTASILGSSNIATGGKLAKAGNYVFLSYNNSASFEALQTIDVATPASPTVLNAGNNAWSLVDHARIAISGSTAYIADKIQGLRVLDVNNPISPSTIQTIPAQSSVSDVAVYDNYLYAADGTGVRVFDISNPNNPVFTRTITTTYTAKLVAVSDGIGAVVTEQTYGVQHHLCIFVPAPH